MESILNTIKRKIGYPSEEKCFDDDIIIGINSTLSVLYQIGFFSNVSFYITDETSTWDELFAVAGIDDPAKMNYVIDYIYMKTKLIFDPPQSATHIESMRKFIDEFEWRTYSEVSGRYHNHNKEVPEE